MLSPHEIATLLLAAASLGPIDADALEPPDLAALEQARLVHVDVDEGHTRVSVTDDGHRVLRRLGLERSGGERGQVPRLTITAMRRVDQGAGSDVSARSAPTDSLAGKRPPEWQQAAALPANASERGEEQA